MTRFRGRRRLVVPLPVALSTATGLVGVTTAASGRGHAASVRSAADDSTATPIKHVIVIIGENHTFDNVYGTYQPSAGQHVMNLLSEGIVNTSGGAGTNVGKAAQNTATDTNTYQLDPQRTGTYASLPRPNTTYVSPACDGQPGNTTDKRFPDAHRFARANTAVWLRAGRRGDPSALPGWQGGGSPSGHPGRADRHGDALRAA
jgi:phospholipase C